MPVPKPVIHIHAGLPKTGTSAIQRFLALNRAALADQGLLVPEHALGARGDHHEWLYEIGGLGWAARRRAVRQMVRYLDARKPEQVLISSEFAYLLARFGFASHSFQGLRKAGYDLKFHLFLRPQTDFAVSAHPEFLRNLLVDQPFERFVEQNFLPFAQDYGRIVRDLEKLSGNPVNVLPYTGAARRAGVWWSLLDGTGAVIGDREQFETPGEVNRSLGPIGVMALTQALRRTDRRVLMKRWGMRRGVRTVVLHVTGNFPPETERYNPLSPAERQALWERCRPQNDPLAERLWGQPWDAVFAEEANDRSPRKVYRRRLDDDGSPRAKLHDKLSLRLFRRMKAKIEAIEDGRAGKLSLKRVFGSPVDRLADRAMKRIVRGL